MAIIKLLRAIGLASITLLLAMTGCSAGTDSSNQPIGSTQQALTNGDTGFVWSGSPTSSWYSANSTGGINQVTHLATGQYRADFPGLGSVIGGNVQVTAYGSGSERCKVRNWNSAGTTLQVFVNCFSVTGAAVDTFFTAQYQRRTDTVAYDGAYVWSWDASSSSYDPNTSYQWNSSGLGTHINHSFVGKYDVYFDGFAGAMGTAEATAYGSDNSYCSIEDFSGGLGRAWVRVDCFNGSTGAPIDAQFTLIYSQKSPNNTSSYTYAFASEPTLASYNPVSWWPSACAGSVATSPSDCGPLTPDMTTITRSSTGRYSVNLPRMGVGSFYPSTVKITALDSFGNSCKVTSWGGGTGSATVGVACFSPSGAAVDAQFLITFASYIYVIC